MAVPKKRTSKSKRNIRRNLWKQKGIKQLTRIFSLIKLGLKENIQSD